LKLTALIRAGNVRCSDDIGKLPQGMIARQRISPVCVQSGAGNPALTQGFQHGGFLNNRSASRVKNESGLGQSL
jgi:hypothetical protein